MWGWVDEVGEEFVDNFMLYYLKIFPLIAPKGRTGCIRERCASKLIQPVKRGQNRLTPQSWPDLHVCAIAYVCINNTHTPHTQVN